MMQQNNMWSRGVEIQEERKTEEDRYAGANTNTGAAGGQEKEVIELNTMADLQKLSFLDIKNLPLSKVRGDVFEAAMK